MAVTASPDRTAGFLPPSELSEALNAENRHELFLGGSVDLATQTLTLWRGDAVKIKVPLSVFESSGDGIEPDFTRFSVIDYGQTVRFGDYEAASIAIIDDWKKLTGKCDAPA